VPTLGVVVPRAVLVWTLRGIVPDIEVEYSAAEAMKGRDAQLERAVQEALKLLEQQPVKKVGRPVSIDRASKKP